MSLMVFSRQKRTRHDGRGKGDNVAVHSHPIADSVNQLSVASFIRMVNDVVKLPVGDRKSVV